MTASALTTMRDVGWRGEGGRLKSMVVAGRRIYAFRPYIFCPPFPAAPAAADKARDFGAGPLFNQILPLLMSPTLEDQERHLLVKVRCGCRVVGCV